MKLLSQVLALEKGAKSRFEVLQKDFNKAAQKSTLFNGARKTFRPIKEGGTQFPDERQEVQMNVEDKLDEYNDSLVEILNVTAVRDYGNCEAKADVIVDEQAILTGVPATYLLWLNKRLEDMDTLIGNLPVLDPAEKWESKQGNITRSAEVETVRMSKEPTVIQLAPPTKEHAEQSQLINKDVPIGHWTTTKLSGAIEAGRKQLFARRVRKLHDAVKVALQEANSSRVVSQSIGDKVSKFIFGEES